LEQIRERPGLVKGQANRRMTFGLGEVSDREDHGPTLEAFHDDIAVFRNDPGLEEFHAAGR
jgi:hypothetical protein